MIYTLDKIQELAEGDQDFVLSVVSVFLEEVPVDLQALESELENGNIEQIYKLAHKLKPNLDWMGMEPARVLALEIETMGKQNQPLDAIRPKFPLLKKDIEQAIQELKKDFSL